ncbi:glutamate 5-kinase, partial [Streptomyces sp. SID10244]|nr:glutamate 5-kinase [Streptomyces sp. SID10244]
SADAGVPVLLAAADQAPQALADASVGTVFAARDERLSARRFWVRHAADARGQLVLDDGAVAAVARRRRSLLAAGIVGVNGRFYGGDVVELVDLTGAVRARGVVAY